VFLAYFLEMNFILKMIRSNNIYVRFCTIVMPGIGCFFKRVGRRNEVMTKKYGRGK
jgi:hypothetical protein